MLKKIILINILFISSMYAKFTTLSTQDVEQAIKNNVTIIDIRRAEEFKKYGIIKSSHKITFFDDKGKYDIEKWMNSFTKIVKSKDQKFILVCAHANRTKVVAKFLSDILKYTNVNELKGGINYGWLDKNRKTIRN